MCNVANALNPWMYSMIGGRGGFQSVNKSYSLARVIYRDSLLFSVPVVLKLCSNSPCYSHIIRLLPIIPKIIVAYQAQARSPIVIQTPTTLNDALDCINHTMQLQQRLVQATLESQLLIYSPMGLYSPSEGVHSNIICMLA